MVYLWIAILLGIGVYYSIRYGWWRKTVPWCHPRVLMYHLITEHPQGGKYRGMRVRPSEFERQLKWLTKRGFHFVTMRDLQGSPVQERSVAITFDDGYEDNYLNAFPLLKKYGAKATLYLVADREEGSDWSAKKKAHHNSGELTRERKLSDAQVQEMLDSGIWELGGHTLTHANLSQLDLEGKRGEIAGSREWLEERFRVEVSSFAYTFGIWDEADREVVRDAGYRTSVTTEPGIDVYPFADPLAISRIKVSGKENQLAFQIRMRCGRRGLWK